MSPDGLSSKNISTILSGSKGQLPTKIKCLLLHKSTLIDLLQSGPFDGDSMAGLLARSGKDIGRVIQGLCKCRPIIGDILSAGIFDARGVAGMLMGSGRYLPNSAQVLSERMDSLRRFVDNGWLDGRTLSAILAGAGKDIGNAIDQLVASAELLSDLTRDDIGRKRLRSYLRGSSTRKLAKKLDAFYLAQCGAQP